MCGMEFSAHFEEKHVLLTAPCGPSVCTWSVPQKLNLGRDQINDKCSEDSGNIPLCGSAGRKKWNDKQKLNLYKFVIKLIQYLYNMYTKIYSRRFISFSGRFSFF